MSYENINLITSFLILVIPILGWSAAEKENKYVSFGCYQRLIDGDYLCVQIMDVYYVASSVTNSVMELFC